MTQLRAVAALCAALSLGGCVTHEQTAPPLAGPSGFGLSLSLTSTPEALPRDGSSQATIVMNARDEVGNAPIAGQRIALTAVPSTATLSAREVTTGSDGRAAVLVTAPPAAAADADISVVATPVGGVSDRMGPRVVQIGLIFDATLDPAARFTVLPAQPAVGQEALFDASSSTASTGSVIVEYAWSFGDGTSEVTTTPTVDKTYDEARTFAVILTVTDNKGRSSSEAQTVTVVP